MPEDSEDQKSERPDVQHYLSVIRRRHIQFLIPLLFGWLVVWGASWVLPARYKSTTLILVEQPTMPKNYIESNVNDNLQDRLQSMNQEIMSRTRLLTIIDKLHLYSDGRQKMTSDEKVLAMGKDIDVELVRDTHDEITAFKVSYSSHDPHLAQQVTSELTGLFINENQKVVQQESQDTTNFIASQLENARASLAEQEAKVRDFQGRHEGSLPTQQASNLQILSGLQSQLQNEQDALNTAKQQRVYLQSLIEQYRGVRGTTSRTVDGTPTGLAAIDKELDDLRAKLTDLSSRYTDRYPDVLKVKDEIAKTEKRRDDLLAEMRNKGKASNDSTAVRDGADPSQSSPSMQLQGQLQANQVEISNREQSVAGLKGRINDYQGRLNEEPAVEQQMADLTRGYEQSKADYDDLLKKKNQSEMATSMEQMQQGERFSMIDPPSLPLKPDFPNRLKFCGIGLGVGLALGLIVAGGFEVLDDRLYSEKEIRAVLPMAILSEVPEVQLPSDGRRSMRNAALGWSMAALVFATILAGSAFSYLHN
jgi:polysaccharide chain length determinant protein (PEP-CTERM system associated)